MTTATRSRNKTSKSAAGQSLLSECSQRLRAEVMQSDPGRKLAEWALSREYGMSRSLVRLAMSDLVNEGLVARSPGRGVFVTEQVLALRTVRMVPSINSTYSGIADRAYRQMRRATPGLRLEKNVRPQQKSDVRIVCGFELPSRARRLQPIESWLEVDEALEPDQFDRDALDIFRFDGHLYALPLLRSAAVVHYNPRLFDQAGAPHPSEDWTWPEMIDAAKRLHRPEEGLGGLGLRQLERLFTVMVWSFDGELAVNDGGPWDFQTPPVRRAMALLQALCPFITNAPTADLARQFAEGRLAMLPTGGVIAGLIGSSLPDWIRGVPMPRGDRRATWILSEGVGIDRACHNPALARRFVEQLVGRESQQRMADAGLYAATRPDVDQPGTLADVYRSQLRYARVPRHLDADVVTSVLRTQLEHLTPQSDIEELCLHTGRLINGILQDSVDVTG